MQCENKRSTNLSPCRGNEETLNHKTLDGDTLQKGHEYKYLRSKITEDIVVVPEI